MSASSESRQTYFDVFKGLLIIFVVIGHGIETNIIESNMMSSSIYFYFYLFHMPSFIFLLGYFSKSTARSNQKIASRICFFIVLYAIGKVIYYEGYKLVNGALPIWAYSSVLKEDALPWYMLSAAFFMASLWLARKLPAWLLIPVSAAAGLFCGAIPNIGPFLCLSRTLIFWPFFLLGYYFPKKAFDRFLSKKRSWCWIAVILMIVGWILCKNWLTADAKRYYEFIPALYCNQSFANMGFSFGQGLAVRGAFYIAAVILSTLLALSAYAITPIVGGTLLTQFGRNTLAPYLVHYPIFLFAIKFFGGTISPIGFVLIALLIIIVFSADLWDQGIRLINKGFMKLFGLFIKEK